MRVKIPDASPRRYFTPKPGHRLSCLVIEGTCRGAVVGLDQGEDFGAITVAPPVPGTIEINRMPA